MPSSIGAGVLVLVCWALPGAGKADPGLPAFPGAEGFGAAAVGGRGGRVMKVTNLKADGPGSLQAACAAEGPRIVVFEVSGVIRGDVTIRHSNITIAGQTAPGAGVTIEGILKKQYATRETMHDLVIRHVRARPKRAPRKWAGGDCVQIGSADRVILDHVSVSWGNDENMDFCGTRNLTVQWCTIEESDTEGHNKGQHNFGMIVGYAGYDVSVHHNLFAHHMRRAPLCGLEVLDHRNNVIYNMRCGLYWHPASMNQRRPGKGFRANIVGDYFKSGPDAPKTGRDLNAAIIDAKDIEEIHAAGNHFTWADGVIDPWKHPLRQGVFSKYPIRAERPWPAAAVTTQSAEEAYRLVLAGAGCLPRDHVTRRQVQETITGTGKWGRNAPAAPTDEWYLAGLKPGQAPKDTDEDGMPDAWEAAHGLDPADPADGARLVPAGASPADRHKGYTYVEFYLNDLADKLAADALKHFDPKGD